MDDLLYRNLFSALPVLQTKHLTLRPFTDGDLYDVNEYMATEEVSRYLRWTPHLNLRETRGYLEFIQKRYRKGQHADWAVVLNDTGKVIGNCGFTSVDITNECCELGYVLSPSYWGKGYMDEALAALLEVAFQRLEANRVILQILEGNDASVRFALRNGFREEGREVNALMVKGDYRTVLRFAMLKSEYPGNK
ncbi:MAG: GNAT family N-acetyltransferase [Clostridia bacterium]|nr:GNAT family N-acetyltransferase [Clostridia bacterium]